MEHMKTNNLFSNKQFRFLPGRSTILQLLTVLDTWTETLDAGKITDVIYLDFQKAFDKVPHRRLIQEIRRYGLDGDILTWTENFLTDRQQRVTMQGESSSWTTVTSGIPQGTVLGPVLFILYINSLPSIVNNSHLYLFADDAKLFNSISNPTDYDLY